MNRDAFVFVHQLPQPRLDFSRVTTAHAVAPPALVLGIYRCVSVPDQRAVLDNYTQSPAAVRGFSVTGVTWRRRIFDGRMECQEESHVEHLRRQIVEAYTERPTGCGNSFGEILCHEIHTCGLTFDWLARKWGLSLAMLGELIADHCRRLEKSPLVDHNYKPD